MTASFGATIVAGGYWLVRPAPVAELAIVAAVRCCRRRSRRTGSIAEDIPAQDCSSSRRRTRLQRGWSQQPAARDGGAGDAHRAACFGRSARRRLVTVLDGHPATLVVARRGARPPDRRLGVDRFGQSGDIPDLYRIHGIDADAIVDAAARVCVMGHVSTKGVDVN